MNILDENIPKNQRQLLESWRISIRQIGVNVGSTGMKDREIISFLQQIRRSTFFTMVMIETHVHHPRRP